MNISQEVLNNNYINVRTLTLKEKEIPFGAFLLACEKGYLNIVQYFVSGKYGEIQDSIQTIKEGIDFGIMTAKENNHNDVIKFLSNYDFNNPSFINLCTYQELFDYYVEKNSIKLSHIINDILAYKRFDLYKQFIIKDEQYKDVLIRDINIKSAISFFNDLTDDKQTEFCNLLFFNLKNVENTNITEIIYKLTKDCVEVNFINKLLNNNSSDEIIIKTISTFFSPIKAMEISKKFNIQLPHNILMSYLKNFCYTEKVNDFSVFLIQYPEIIENLVRENFDELSTALFYYFKPISLCVIADILNDDLLFNKINTTTANDCLIYFEEGGKNNRQGDYNPKKMKKIFIQNKPIIINLLKNQKLRRNLNHDLFERDTCKVVKI